MLLTTQCMFIKYKNVDVIRNVTNINRPIEHFYEHDMPFLLFFKQENDLLESIECIGVSVICFLIILHN